MKKIIRLIIILIFSFILLCLANKFFWYAAYPVSYQREVEQISARHNLEPALVLAVIKAESNFNPEAYSHANAMGLMQITTDTFYFITQKGDFPERDISVLYEPSANIELGSWFLNYLLNEFVETETALAAYNAGRTNVKKWLKDERFSSDGSTLHTIPFKETSNYVKKVMKNYEIYKKLY